MSECISSASCLDVFRWNSGSCRVCQAATSHYNKYRTQLPQLVLHFKRICECWYGIEAIYTCCFTTYPWTILRPDKPSNWEACYPYQKQPWSVNFHNTWALTGIHGCTVLKWTDCVAAVRAEVYPVREALGTRTWSIALRSRIQPRYHHIHIRRIHSFLSWQIDSVYVTADQYLYRDFLTFKQDNTKIKALLDQRSR